MDIKVCFYCKKPLEKDEMVASAIGGGDICKDCASRQRDVLRMIAGIGGRTLV